MKKVENPIEIEGIGGDIKVEEAGILKWELITTKGQVVELYHMGHYAPQLGKVRLLSPQHCLQNMNNAGEFAVKLSTWEFRLENGQVIEGCMHADTGLPIMMGFPDVKQAAKQIALLHSIITPDNQNLTTLQKELLKAHYRLGHLGMQATQWIGRKEILGKN